MGYESRIYVVEHNYLKNAATGRELVHNDVIAAYDLCKLGNGTLAQEFYRTFREEIVGTLPVGENDEKEDCYGDTLKWASVSDVLHILYEMENSEELGDYRRIHPALSMLQGFLDSESEYKNLKVIFYGY